MGIENLTNYAVPIIRYNYDKQVFSTDREKTGKLALDYKKVGTANITYFDGKKLVQKEKPISNATLIFQGFRDILLSQKGQNGTIKKEQALQLLQKLFENGSNTQGKYFMKFSYESGGHLSAIKDLFELYMDNSSDGGENITKQEQFAIMRTLDNWYKDAE